MAQFDLVFEGGGAKGNVFIGALQEFEDKGHEPHRLIGTSAGAITATMLAAGYTAAEMQEIAEETAPDGRPVFATFMDTPTADSFSDATINGSLTQRMFDAVDIPFIPKWIEKRLDRQLIKGCMALPIYRKLFSFIERGGLYGGQAFRNWFQQKIDAKRPGLGMRTLQEFHAETRRDLSLVASDTVGRRMLVLNHRTAPGCPVAWAVRMSMSIPFIWQEVKWQREWGPYLGEDLTGHTIVDGGLLSNFPLDLVVKTNERVASVMGDADPTEADSLGLLIDETIEVPNAGDSPDDVDEGEDTEENVKTAPERLKTIRRVQRLINTMMSAHDKAIIATHKKYICHLPAKGYGTTEFDMPKARMEALITAGREAMEKHLQGRR